jgi:hypothetical protein
MATPSPSADSRSAGRWTPLIFAGLFVFATALIFLGVLNHPAPPAQSITLPETNAAPGAAQPPPSRAVNASETHLGF